MANQKPTKQTKSTESSKPRKRERVVAHTRGFMGFIREQGVVGLAVGLVLGGAVTVVVRSLIDNLVMPPLGFVLGSADGLRGLTLKIGERQGEAVLLNYGTFLNDCINFAVIAATIYLVVHMLGLDKKLDKVKKSD